jgi:mannose-6-phosphate isomerase-like protein (cupin superfamily)
MLAFSAGQFRYTARKQRDKNSAKAAVSSPASLACFLPVLGMRIFVFLLAGAILAEFPGRAETPDFSGPDRGQLSVVNINDQPWATADDHAVARQIVSPQNSRARKLSIADIIIPPGVTVREHHHAVIEEIYYIIGGKGIMWINGATRHVGIGDAIVIRPGEHHSITNPYQEKLHMIVTCVPAWSPDCLIFDK